ncbi:MAG: hypothetical protein ACXVZZ_11200, partial [Terriglobales bacterium]
MGSSRGIGSEKLLLATPKKLSHGFHGRPRSNQLINVRNPQRGFSEACSLVQQLRGVFREVGEDDARAG